KLEVPELPDLSTVYATYSAEEVFQQAKETYPEIRQAAYNSMAAKTNIEIVKGGFYPQLSLGAGIGSGYSSASVDPVTNQRTVFSQQLNDNLSEYIGVSLNIPIFNNFRTRISVRRAKISYQNALLNEQQAENNLNKIINQAVLDVRAAEKNYYSSQQ